MTATATQQLFHFDVTVTSTYSAYSAQVSGVGRDFDEALADAANQERAQLAEQGDELVSFELIGGTDETVDETLTVEQIAKFEQILKAEDEVRTARVTAGMGMTFADRTRGAQQLPKRRTALHAMIDALTLEEMAAYGEYRKAQRTA